MLKDAIHSIQIRDLDNGGRVLHVRGRFGDPNGGPLKFRCGGGPARLTVDGLPSNASAEDLGLATSAVREAAREAAARGGVVEIEGVASSTGVDSYGTEMSLRCLRTMADQFIGGRAYAPTHGEREWHEVIGRTVRAVVRPVDAVENAANPADPAYVLVVGSQIRTTHPRGRELVDALAAGDPIGQSIGGWFLEFILHEDENGRITRVIVDDIELDHLASTRSPANGDSDGLRLIRTQLGESVRSATAPIGRARALSGELATRHVLSVEDRGASWGIAFAKDDGFEALASQLKTGIKPPNARHVVQFQEEDDRIVLFLAKYDEEGDEEDLAAPAPAQRAEAPATPIPEPEQPAERTSPEQPAEPSAATPATTEPEQPATTTTEAARASEDDTMDPKLIALFENMNATMERVLAELSALRAAPAPAPAAAPARAAEPDPRDRLIVSLRAENEALSERVFSGDVRATRSHPARFVSAADMDAFERGDLSPLITRAEEEGSRPATVRAVKTSLNVRALLADHQDRQAIDKGEVKVVDVKTVRAALLDLFNGYARDGGFRPTGNAWA